MFDDFRILTGWGRGSEGCHCEVRSTRNGGAEISENEVFWLFNEGAGQRALGAMYISENTGLFASKFFHRKWMRRWQSGNHGDVMQGVCITVHIT